MVAMVVQLEVEESIASLLKLMALELVRGH